MKLRDYLRLVDAKIIGYRTREGAAMDPVREQFWHCAEAEAAETYCDMCGLRQPLVALRVVTHPAVRGYAHILCRDEDACAARVAAQLKEE